ncbi:MAG: cyclic nucleotide-binding domain-containing protein [Thermoanaerobaculia bacterium]|nr:cyclic nucleotide-binding domain-containing protein [Thermoanaerobaculia bacterium]
MAAPTTSPGACGVREAAALLAESETSGSLAEPLRNRLAGAMSRTSFGTGETLLRQGEVSDSLFVVAAGRFEVRLRRDGGIEDAIGTIGPGGAVGEMQLVVGGVASATLVAVEEAQVLRLRRQLFDVLCDESPELLETVARVAGRRVRRHRMLDVLPSLLGPLDGGVLGAIEEQATWLTLRSGEVLFHKGDPGDAWYVVTSGRMAVVEPSGGDQADRLLAEVGPGEALGELSLLTGEPRSATVYALRDAELVRFPMDRFAELVSEWPQVANAMLRTLARRLVARGNAPRHATGAGLTLALVPATPGVDVAAFAERLAGALSRFGPTLHASSARLDEIGIAREKAGFSGSHPAWIRVDAWLERWPPPTASCCSWPTRHRMPGAPSWSATPTRCSSSPMRTATRAREPWRWHCVRRRRPGASPGACWRCCTGTARSPRVTRRAGSTPGPSTRTSTCASTARTTSDAWLAGSPGGEWRSRSRAAVRAASLTWEECSRCASWASPSTWSPGRAPAPCRATWSRPTRATTSCGVRPGSSTRHAPSAPTPFRSSP